MLTLSQAIERSHAIWGPSIGPPELAGAAWLFHFPNDPTTHRIDGTGRVACGHPGCVARERMATSDAIANRRVRLQRVLHTRLGMPDRIDVIDPAGRVRAVIVATEGAIEIMAAAGDPPLTIEPAPRGRFAPLRIVFGGP